MEIWCQTKLDEVFVEYLRIPPSGFAEFHHVTASSCSGELLEATRESLLGMWHIAERGCDRISQRCWIFLGFCVCMCVHLFACVSRALWCPLIPNLTDLLQRQPLMCAESLSGILDAVSIIFNSYSLIRNPLFCFHAGKHTHLCQDCPAGQVAAVLWVCLHLQVCFYQFFVL